MSNCRPNSMSGGFRHARRLDTVQRDVIAPLRASGGRIAIPEELWELQDHTEAATVEDDGDRVHGHGELSARL